MGFLGRLLGKQPPKVPAGASVQIEDGFDPGIGVSSPTFRVYWSYVDASGQEMGGRHYLGETFETNGYAEAYREWVRTGGKTPLPDYPAGAV